MKQIDSQFARTGVSMVKTYPFTKVIQDLDLNKGLMMEPFLVPDNLDSHGFTSAVVPAVENLTKGAFP